MSGIIKRCLHGPGGEIPRLPGDQNLVVQILAGGGNPGLVFPETGSVNYETWEAIYNQFIGIEDTTLRDFEHLPITAAVSGASRSRNTAPTHITQFPGTPLSSGDRDPIRQEVRR